MTIYLATTLEDSDEKNRGGAILTKVRYSKRLLSYFYIMKLRLDTARIKEYVLTGMIKR
jgi:hypothetical protein